MFYSGLVVTSKPGQFESVGEALKSLPVEVHQSDAASGRYVVVLEEPSIEAETERFRAIQSLPSVALMLCLSSFEFIFNISTNRTTPKTDFFFNFFISRRLHRIKNNAPTF